ncbi:MAG TPA: hypothetical protein DEP32_06610, partial [Pseudomonas sp.]|nr:hypothetical protein [Pseudomonas sp.]
YNRRFAAFWQGTGVRITEGTSLGEVKRMALRAGLIVDTDAAADGHLLHQLRDQRWMQVSERPTREGGLVIMYTDITDL